MPSFRRTGLGATLVLVMLAIVAPTNVAAAGRFTDDNGSKYEKAIEAVAAAGVMPGCTTHHFCPKTVVTKGKLAVYLARALHLKATVKTKFRDVPQLAGERREEGRGGQDHEGLLDDALLPEHGDHARTDGRPAGQGAAPEGHRQYQVQGRLEAPQVRDGHQPTRDRRARRHLRERQVLPGPQDDPGRGRRVPRQGHGAHHRHAPAPDAGQPRRRRLDPGRKRSPWTRRIPTMSSGRARRRAAPARRSWPPSPRAAIITFDCGPNPVTIPMTATAKVFNDKPDVVLDGGGLVTLDGQGARRILYQNTCDPAQVWTTRSLPGPGPPRR